MSDLDSRLLAAVTRNAKSRCYGVTAINSLQNSGVTLSPLVTPELSRKISPVTPLHPKSAGWEGQEKDSTKPKGNPAQAESDTWTNVAEERAAAAEHNGGAPRPWSYALARLDPKKPPADVPPRRLLRFIDDCGRFLDDSWASQAEALGWGPLDLFGCNRERPFARLEHAGLLWLLNGRKLVALTADTATIETLTGAGKPITAAPSRSGL